MFLTDRSHNDDFHNKKPLRASDCTARTSLRHSVRGSMSLEAAAAVPLFIFFVMNLLFLFDAIRLQSRSVRRRITRDSANRARLRETRIPTLRN